MLKFKWYRFDELSLEQLYAILAIRSEVFVVEQQCDYLDADGKDQQALHLVGKEDSAIVAYLRLFKPNANGHVIFGRVLTAKAARTKGYGKKLLQELISYCEQNFPQQKIECSAQYYLVNFYKSFGFKEVSEIYQDAGIPHLDMVR